MFDMQQVETETLQLFSDVPVRDGKEHHPYGNRQRSFMNTLGSLFWRKSKQGGTSSQQFSRPKKKPRRATDLKTARRPLAVPDDPVKRAKWLFRQTRAVKRPGTPEK